MKETEFRLSVNGTERSVTCGPDTPLLDVLRHDLGLAGPKFGCGTGLCGACFVLIGDRVRSSCDLPVSALDGPVITVEGLPAGGGLHPVQQAFIDEQAAQCGYCTAGLVVAAAGLLCERPVPAEQEVREALDGNLCRCGAHGRIIRAVLKAAGGMSAGEGSMLAPPSGSPDPVAAAPAMPSGVSPLPADLAANPAAGYPGQGSRASAVPARSGPAGHGLRPGGAAARAGRRLDRTC
jgi:nicotinate dehydrogenase subunit A